MAVPTTSHALCVCCGKFADLRYEAVMQYDAENRPLRNKNGSYKTKRGDPYWWCVQTARRCEVAGSAPMVDYGLLQPPTEAERRQMGDGYFHNKTMTYGRSLVEQGKLADLFLIRRLDEFPDGHPLHLSSGPWVKYDGLWQLSGSPETKLTSEMLLIKHGDEKVVEFE